MEWNRNLSEEQRMEHWSQMESEQQYNGVFAGGKTVVLLTDLNAPASTKDLAPVPQIIPASGDVVAASTRTTCCPAVRTSPRCNDVAAGRTVE